jgi:hypothetical protein
MAGYRHRTMHSPNIFRASEVVRSRSAFGGFAVNLTAGGMAAGISIIMAAEPTFSFLT